jgi:hypothetical protein
MKLKHPQGWFAAGREVSRAIEVLSDAAFKLYIYVCLHLLTGQSRPYRSVERSD